MKLSTFKAKLPAVFREGSLAVLGGLFLLPLVWVILAAVDATATWSVEWPHLTLDHFKLVFRTDMRSFIVSLYLAAIATVVGTVTALLAGYALARRYIPLKDGIIIAVLFLSGLPVSTLVVPIFLIYSRLEWFSILPTGLLLGAVGLPLQIWLARNFVEAIPIELEQAAILEGAGTLYVLRTVVAPLIAPGMAATAIFGFVNAWGSFLLPLVTLVDPNNTPAPVKIYSFISSAMTRYGEIAAFSLVYAVPAIVLYGVMARVVSGGFRYGGAMKG
jgi:multiple sugar transport system permease protein